MKNFFFCALAALATIGMISRAEAKDPEDAESDHVIVTLKSVSYTHLTLPTNSLV